MRGISIPKDSWEADFFKKHTNSPNVHLAWQVIGPIGTEIKTMACYFDGPDIWIVQYYTDNNGYLAFKAQP